jgi:hypothetical protein
MKITSMRPVLHTLILFFFVSFAFGQTVQNSNFSSNTSYWGCNPEVNSANTYGASGQGANTNKVAEVDEEANLCQTITGFTPGTTYQLTFLASRRTSCGPTFQSINVSINGGALSATVTRNGTNFSLTQETFIFTASSPAHTLSFSSSLQGTCNMVVDNIDIKIASVMPVELTAFFAQKQDEKVQLDWSTASETRNDHYTIERSADAQNWETIATVQGAGTTAERQDYTFLDEKPLNGISYYRLSQTDLDGTVELLDVLSVEMDLGSAITAYPNPASDVLTITGVEESEAIVILDGTGRTMPFSVTASGHGNVTLDITTIPTGSYLLKTQTGYLRFSKK